VPDRPIDGGGDGAGRSVMVVPLWSGAGAARQDHGGLGGAPSRGGDADRG
jgi:hypothetical protein